MEFTAALADWTRILNERYGLQATEDEVLQSFNENLRDKETFDGLSYVDEYIKSKDGTWDNGLDTDDREILLVGVREIRQRNFINSSTVLTVPVTFKVLSEAKATDEEILRVVLEALELADFSYSPRARLIQVALLAAQNKHNDVEPT